MADERASARGQSSRGKSAAGQGPDRKQDRADLVAELAALSAEASSPDGAVAVSVNADGVLTKLRLSDAIEKMSPADIANAVLRAYAQAQRESAKRCGRLLISAGAGGYVVDRLKWRMGFQPELQSATERARSAPPVEPSAVRNPRDAQYEYLKDRSLPGYNLVPPIAAPPADSPVGDDQDGDGFRVMGQR